MSSYVVTFDLPPRILHPNHKPRSLRAFGGAKKKYRDKCADIAAVELRIKQGVAGVTHGKIKLRYYFRTAHQRDDDNLIAWAKSARDSLTQAGVIVDDKDLVNEPVEWSVDRERPRLEIVITPEER